jgi:hypothetical protein
LTGTARAETPDETSRVLGIQRADDARADFNGDDLPPLVDASLDFVFSDQDAKAAARSLEGPLEEAMRHAEQISLARLRHTLVAAGATPASVGVSED